MMITIHGQLCYSPQPPEAYAHLENGIGNWVNGDIQTWNLIYLSAPEVDLYLEGIPVHLLPMYEEGRGRYIGDVMACTNPLCDSHVTTRELLKLRPTEFVKGLVKTAFQILPAYARHGMPWIETIRSRAAALEVPGVSIEAVQGNVVYAQFAKK